MRWHVTLTSATGSIERTVRAADEWEARQRAIRLERGRGYWCSAARPA